MGGIQTGGPFEFFRYTPSVPAAAVFIGLFGLLTALHAYQLFRTRTWIMIPFVVGGTCEFVGYIGRILAHNEAPNFTVGPFLLQAMLILWSPTWFAASIYMCLGRIMRVTNGGKYSLISPRIVTTVFVSCDFIGLVIQGVGSGVSAAGTLNDYYTGNNIVIGGLAVLVASFGFFVVIAVTFDIRMRRNPTPEALASPLNWRRNLIALYAASFLILLRSIFRLVEFVQGNSGWAMSHEWTFYVFDSTLMFFVMTLFNVVHPSHVTALLRGGSYSRWMGLKYETVQTKPEAV